MIRFMIAAAIAVAAAGASAEEVHTSTERTLSLAADAYFVASGECEPSLAADSDLIELAKRAVGYNVHWVDELASRSRSDDEFVRLYSDARAKDPSGRLEIELERRLAEIGPRRACAEAAERIAAAGAADIVLHPSPPEDDSTEGQAAEQCGRAVRHLLAAPDRYRRGLPPTIDDADPIDLLGVSVPSRVVMLSFMAAGSGEVFLSPHSASCRFAWPADPDQLRALGGRIATDEDTTAEEERLADRSNQLLAVPTLHFPAPLLWSVDIDGRQVDATIVRSIRLAGDRFQ